MRYAHGGGLTPKEQEKRERVRLEAAERFTRGEKTEAVARELRVTSRSVRRWRREWEQGGREATAARAAWAVESGDAGIELAYRASQLMAYFSCGMARSQTVSNALEHSRATAGTSVRSVWAHRPSPSKTLK